MADQPCLATVRGLPHLPEVTEINVRSGPGTGNALIFKAGVGTDGLEIVDVQSDDANTQLNDKIYRWFRLRFPDGTDGWIRDDLLAILGDCRTWGYPVLVEPTFAFALTRDDTATTPEQAASAFRQAAVTESARSTTSEAARTTTRDLARVRKAAFRITVAFEGTGYKAYNNYDRGIISYGLIQFTLASGSLLLVLNKYLAAADSPTANDLRNYMSRVQMRDEALRDDKRFRDLLLIAADEPAMQQAQEEVATIRYWTVVQEGYIKPRGLQTPLAHALLFDMGVNFGTGHGFVRLAEQQLGVPARSRPGENGITEAQLIEKVAALRKTSHDRQAERDNLPGLKVRGDFWVDRVRKGDWELQGDADGYVNVGGRLIPVSKP